MSNLTDNEQMNEAVNGISNTDFSIPTPPGFQVSGPADPVEVSQEVEAETVANIVNGQEQAPDFEAPQEDLTPVIVTDTETESVQEHMETEPEPEQLEQPEPEALVEPTEQMEVPVEPVEQPVESTEPKDSGKRGKSKKITQRRLDGFSALPQIIKIKNETLRYAIDLFFRNPKKEQIDAELDIQGEIMHKFDAECIFEEGGATASEGHALIVTNPDGTKVSPFFVYISSHNNVVNGRHAMYRIGIDFYVLIAGQKQGRSFVAVYRITDVRGVTKDIPNPRFHGILVGYLLNGTNWTSVIPNTDLSGVNWSADHPAVRAAQERIFELYATSPIYAAPYAEDRFYADDFNSCVTDKAFAAQRVEENTLTEAYEHAELPLIGFLEDIGTDRKVIPLMTICLQYSKADDTVTAFILSTYFNFETKTSEGNRKYYGRVVLKSGDIFYYPDKDIEHGLTFETLKEKILANGGAAGIAFRRMTLN